MGTDMSNMTDLKIEREVVIDAPVDAVWRTVTEPDQISQWFADRVELDATPGGAGVFIFHNEEGKAIHTATLVVEAVEPPTRFSFRWCHPEGAVPVSDNSILVEFTLRPDGGERTRLRVAESGLDLVAWPEDDKVRYAEEHRKGWANFVDRLAGLLADCPAG
jgi:uncharacterized protein YndB with AHSA1/START domain